MRSLYSRDFGAPQIGESTFPSIASQIGSFSVAFTPCVQILTGVLSVDRSTKVGERSRIDDRFRTISTSKSLEECSQGHDE